MARKLRIFTGLILFAFIAGHLINMALGVVSLQWVENSRPYFMFIWANPVGGNILLISIVLHMVLGMHALYLRNTLKMSAYDLVQFLSAVLIMPLLIPHAWGVVGSMTLLNFQLTFPYMIQFFWIETPLEGLRQVLLVVVIWVHACIGMFTWLRLRSWWPTVGPYIYPLAVAIPVLALLGFAEGGNKAVELMRSGIAPIVPGPADPSIQLDRETFFQNFAFLDTVKWYLLYGYGAIVAGVMFARFLRLRKNRGILKIHFRNSWGNERSIVTKAGPTLLEIAIANDIPHANLCRGRGRCGTCRVLVDTTDQTLPPPSELEQATLTRLECPPDMRLACQLKPEQGSIDVEQLIEPDIEDLNQTDIAEVAVVQ